MKIHLVIFIFPFAASLLPAAEIHEAVDKGDAARVAGLIKDDPKWIQEKDKGGNLPLHLAALNGNVKIIQALLAAGADVNAKGFSDWTPLHYAAKSGSAKACLLLLESGANRDALNGFSRTPLEKATGAAAAAIRNYAAKVMGADEVFKAIEAGDSEKVKSLIAAKPETLKAKDGQGLTPLLVAEKRNNPVLVLALLEAGADVNAQDSAGYTSLHDAIEKGKTQLLPILIQHGAKPDLARLDGITPLMTAAGVGDTESMRLLKKAGAKLDASDKNGQNALHLAAAGGHPDAVKWLLEAELPVDASKLNTGSTPLHAAISGASGKRQIAAKVPRGSLGGIPLRDVPKSRGGEADFTKIVEMLISAGADVDHPNRAGITPLHVAAEFGLLNNARLLISKGAKVNARTTDSRTPLHFASGSQSTEMVTLLLDSGADINAVQEKHPSKSTPLAWAVQFGRIDHLKLLLKRGANLDAKLYGEAGATLLHYAVQNQQMDSAKALIDAGIDVDARDSYQSTPLMMGVVTGSEEMLKFLIKQGADVNAKGRGGVTAMKAAISTGKTSLVPLLKASGATE